MFQHRYGASRFVSSAFGELLRKVYRMRYLQIAVEHNFRIVRKVMRRFFVIILAVMLILLIFMDISVFNVAQRMPDIKKMESISYFHYWFFKLSVEIIFIKMLLSTFNLIFCLLQIYCPLKPKVFKYVTFFTGVVHIIVTLIAFSAILVMLMYGTGSNISFSRALLVVFQTFGTGSLISGTALYICFLILLFVSPILNESLAVNESTVNKF